jgi:hypothetical protein
MKTLVLAALLALGGAGCSSTIPAPISRGIAVLDSNTQTLGADYQRVLVSGLASVDSQTRARDLRLLHENASLSAHLAAWARKHTKE